MNRKMFLVLFIEAIIIFGIWIGLLFGASIEQIMIPLLFLLLLILWVTKDKGGTEE